MALYKKSQISFEYIIIVGFTTVIIIALIALSYTYSKDVDDQIALNQVDRIMKSIVDNAESVFYFGEPSKVKIIVYFPKRIKGVTITEAGTATDAEVSFVVGTKEGTTDISKTSSVNISGSLPISPGYHDIIIESKGSYIWVGTT